MADAFKVLYQGQLGNTVATLATVGAAKSWIIRSVSVVNNDSSARIFGLYVGGTTAAHAVTPSAINIPAGGEAEIYEIVWTLEAAQTLAGGASVASQLTITVFGDEIS